MPTHFHLLVYPIIKNFGHQVMHPFSVSYTKAINKRYNRSGPLFQGPYQAKLIDKEKYLLHLSRYIHLNPVAAGLVTQPDHWEHSSYKDYIGIRRGGITRPEIITKNFNDRTEYVEFVLSEIKTDAGVPKNLMIDN